jgi:hypothetical protein
MCVHRRLSCAYTCIYPQAPCLCVFLQCGHHHVCTTVSMCLHVCTAVLMRLQCGPPSRVYRRICVLTLVYRCLYAFSVWTAVMCVYRRLSSAYTCVPRGPVFMRFLQCGHHHVYTAVCVLTSLYRRLNAFTVWTAVICIQLSLCVCTGVPPYLCVHTVDRRLFVFFVAYINKKVRKAFLLSDFAPETFLPHLSIFMSSCLLIFKSKC